MRIGRNTIAMLAKSDGGDDVVYEPFVVKSGVSMAANLREAFKTSDLLLQSPPRVRVLIDSDVMLVPVELFDESVMEQLYYHAFPRQEQDKVTYNVLPDLLGGRLEIGVQIKTDWEAATPTTVILK